MNHTPASPIDSLQDLLTEGVQHQNAGRVVEAEKIYRQILSLNPKHAQSLHMLGHLAMQAQKYDVAEDYVLKAISENNSFYGFHHTLGLIFRAQGKFDQAIASYKQAIVCKPDFIDALNNLGVISQKLLRFDDAINYYKQALAIQPNSAMIYHNLGVLYNQLKQTHDAKSCFEKAIEFKPDHADALYNLGNIVMADRQFELALQYFLRAAAVKPSAAVFCNMSNVLQSTGRLEEAITYSKKALEINPNAFEAFNNLGALSNELKRFDQALNYYEHASELQPKNYFILNNMATTYKNLGQMEQAMEFYKKSLALAPNNAQIYTNLLLTMIYNAEVSPEELAQALRIYGERIADPLLPVKKYKNSKLPERKLRIGYVSPDFRNHPVHYFFEPLLNFQDRAHFESFAYSNLLREDAITQRLRKKFDHWRDVQTLNHQSAADLIEQDQIDILVDLAGHTARTGLPIFAYKPAPIQVTWLGYPASSGMQAMDYRITDSFAEPVGLTESLNTEKLWRLPDMFCCYQANEKKPAVIDHPPFEDNGYITFGCFNNFTKVTNPVLEAWAKIMSQVPDSRLLLEIDGLQDLNTRLQIKERLQSMGLPIERVILEPRKKENQFVLYNRLDIALDPFPCNGGTTSMDTLWMGVPFVTLAGRQFLSRLGMTILSNAGLQELITENINDYVTCAVQLANDRERLKTIRTNLRDRVACSPLMDQKLFTRNFEDALRGMWRAWCAV